MLVIFGKAAASLEIMLAQDWGSHSKVVIADDSLVVRERLVTLLNELAGVEIVGQAEDGAETISVIRTLQPDAVILNIRMPGGSGLEVLRTIKQDKVRPRVIILTNYPYPGYRQKCLQAGADFFLDKSAEFDQIPVLFERLKPGLGFEETQPGYASRPHLIGLTANAGHPAQ